jgi:hypothetical protein
MVLSFEKPHALPPFYGLEKSGLAAKNDTQTGPYRQKLFVTKEMLASYEEMTLYTNMTRLAK